MVEGAMDSSNLRTAPPQYTEIVKGTMDSSDSKTAAPSITSLKSSFLDLSKQFNPATILRNVHKADDVFAKAVVALIGERADNGIFARDCWGYKFLPPVLNLRLCHSNIRTTQGIV